MKKIKYYYNTRTLRYEKLVIPFRVKLLRVLGFIAAALVTSFIIVVIAFEYIDSPKEKFLKQKNETLQQNYAITEKKISMLQQQMAVLEQRDNKVYREIFEASPLSDSIRAQATQKQQDIQFVNTMAEQDLFNNLSSSLQNLSARMAVQSQSYNTIEQLINNKEHLLAATPSIQPVSNKDLTRIASGFGYRIDPIYKVGKMHAGLDFTAPQGTPIYATANGIIKVADYSTGGYGNHVVINHGYGYETLYGHMVRTKVTIGQKITRGEVIGWVGSTGKSTGPHCHYEVHKDGHPVDPIYFFYNDLTPEQYDKLLKLAAASNQSFD